MRRSRAISVLVVLSTLALAACEGGEGLLEDETSPRVPVRTPDASPTGEVGPVIGVVGTMTGVGAWRGEDAFEGADVGVNALNQALGRNGTPYQLVTLDDRGDAERATELVERLAADERTVGIVYAGPTLGLPPAADALAAAGVPALLCFGDLYSARLLRSHLFQMSPPLLWQARRLAAYIARDRRYRRVGLLVHDGLEGTTAARALRTALADQGVARPVVRRYGAEDELRGAVRAMERRRVEALLIHGSPSALPALTGVLRDAGSLYRGTPDARTVSAPPRVRRREASTGRRRPWRPQVMGFDLAVAPSGTELPAGTIASDTYARGAHLLPIPSFRRFREAFSDWWGSEPIGWERRAYDAVAAIGWAARRTEPDGDVAATLERLQDERFGGLDISFGPDDHTAPTEQVTGLWVVPRPDLDLRERTPERLPWVMLGRGFSTNGRRSDIPPQDWAHLFRNPPPRNGPGPPIRTGRFGVTTPRRDPIH